MQKEMPDYQISAGSDARSAGSLLLTSGILFIIFNTIAEGIYPDFSLKTNALSDLGAFGAPTQFLWDGMLLFNGVLGFAGMFFLFRGPALGIGKRKLTSILYLLPPIGAIIVSVFPENSILPAMHLLGAFISFTFGGISAIYAYRFTKSPFKYFSVILGAVSLAATPLLGSGTSIGFGLVERLVLYPYIIWSIAFAGYLLALSPLSQAMKDRNSGLK
ncbi:MAG: DUF998 domain-containing protein [Nitrososphaerales archaeon]